MLHPVTGKPGGPLQRLAGDRRGSVAVPVALVFIVILGFISLGTEIVVLQWTARNMQQAVDAAAFAAATDGLNTDCSVNPSAAGCADALQIVRAAGFNVTGFGVAQNGTTLNVFNSPRDGDPAYIGNTSAVEVSITQSEQLALAALINGGAYSLTRMGVAQASGIGDCLAVLSPGGSGQAQATGADHATLYMTGGSGITFTNCGIGVNSSVDPAVQVSGGTVITINNGTGSSAAVSIVADGACSGASDCGYFYQDGGSFVTPAPKVGQQPFVDPYANVTVPSFTCGSTGVYCSSSGPAPPSSGTLVTGSPYLILAGNFNWSVGSLTVVRANGCVPLNPPTDEEKCGVTIILTQDPSHPGTFAQLGNAGSLAVESPPTGPTAGLAIWQDPKTPFYNPNWGGVNVQVHGAMYFPTVAITISGGGTITGSCVQLIAYWVLLDGGSSTFGGDNCAGTGVRAIGGSGGAITSVE